MSSIITEAQKTFLNRLSRVSLPADGELQFYTEMMRDLRVKGPFQEFLDSLMEEENAIRVMKEKRKDIRAKINESELGEKLKACEGSIKDAESRCVAIWDEVKHTAAELFGEQGDLFRPSMDEVVQAAQEEVRVGDVVLMKRAGEWFLEDREDCGALPRDIALSSEVVKELWIHFIDSAVNCWEMFEWCGKAHISETLDFPNVHPDVFLRIKEQALARLNEPIEGAPTVPQEETKGDVGAEPSPDEVAGDMFGGAEEEEAKLELGEPEKPMEVEAKPMEVEAKPMEVVAFSWAKVGNVAGMPVQTMTPANWLKFMPKPVLERFAMRPEVLMPWWVYQIQKTSEMDFGRWKAQDLAAFLGAAREVETNIHTLTMLFDATPRIMQVEDAIRKIDDGLVDWFNGTVPELCKKRLVALNIKSMRILMGSVGVTAVKDEEFVWAADFAGSEWADLREADWNPMMARLQNLAIEKDKRGETSKNNYNVAMQAIEQAWDTIAKRGLK